jgi:hypothetical protein
VEVFRIIGVSREKSTSTTGAATDSEGNRRQSPGECLLIFRQGMNGRHFLSWRDNFCHDSLVADFSIYFQTEARKVNSRPNRLCSIEMDSKTGPSIYIKQYQ